MSKLLVIVGATGKQGGSVIKSILADPTAKSQFKLRGITRDASKPAAKALISQGVEMVSGDLGDKASIEKAFEGAYGVYAVTDYWATMSKDVEITRATMSKDVEITQGKALADAAKAAGVQHYVWSNLIDVNKATNGKLSKVYHFDSKAEVGEYIKSIGLPHTFYLPAFYMSNLPGSAIRKDDKSGKYTFSLPVQSDAIVPLVDIAEDTGKFVKAIFLNREKTLNQSILGAENYYTTQQVLEAFKQAFPSDGEGITFQTFPDQAYVGMLKGFGMPEFAAEELLENMHLLNKEFGYYSGASLDFSHEILTDKLVSLTDFFTSAPAFKDLK